VLRTVEATRYVTPLREGGSLPGLVEAADDGLYVAKFRGAGQGPRALVAEVVAGELARSLGLPVPELVLLELDPQIGVAEPDPEIQDLLLASGGLNLGVDFLPGALGFTAAAAASADSGFCANVVWLDALVMNLDRTPRNPNGAALYPQHSPAGLAAAARDPFKLVAEHVLLPCAGSIEDAHERLAARAADAVAGAIEAVPAEWQGNAAELAEFFEARLGNPQPWVGEAERARA
jgi:hypothetical protein